MESRKEVEPKFKHNKKKNVAILYELLLRELAKSVLDKDAEKTQQITQVIREFFGDPSSDLVQELRIFGGITGTKGFDQTSAEKLLTLSKNAYNKLDRGVIQNKTAELNSKLKNIFKTPTFFSNFVPNYRTLASLSQIFSGKIAPKTRVLLEQEIVKFMMTPLQERAKSDLEPTDKLVLKTFIKKFNEKYSGLLPEQINFIQKFASSFGQGVEFKLFLEGELKKIKTSLSSFLNEQVIKQNEDLSNKIKEVIALFESFKNKVPDEKLFESLLKTYELIQEFKSDQNKDQR